VKKLFGLVLLLVAGVVHAQDTGTVTVRWVNPTETVANTPLTGVNVLTKFQLWFSSSSQPTLPATPSVEIPATDPLQTTYVYTAPYGSNVYVRMKACNAGGCSDPTDEAMGTVPYPASRPGAPQNVTITVTIP